MAYAKDEIIALIHGFVEKLKSDFPIEQAYLFGSYASGSSDEDSDIDLALISPAIDANNSFELNKKVFHQAMLYNVYLEPICFSPEEFDEESLPIVHEIKRSGIEISTR